MFTAECEVCGKRDEKPDNKGNHMELHMTIFMCRACRAKEKELQDDSASKAEQRVEEHNQRIESYTGFFNARITPIVQVKELYELNGKSLSDYHESIKAQIEQFSRVLFEQVITTTEDQTSKLLIEFRAEIRTKLKEGDISYQPPIKAPKVSTKSVGGGKKQSALEKMAELVVMNAAKSGKIMTLAEATRKLQREMGLT
jgi:hypothetical protein